MVWVAKGDVGEVTGESLTRLTTTLTMMKRDIVFLIFCVCMVLAAWIGGLMVEGWMWGQLGWKGMAVMRLIVEPIAEFVIEVALG